MHQHINKLENLVGKYKAQICVPETDIQELAKQPTLSQGSGMQALHEELVNEKQVLQEVWQGVKAQGPLRCDLHEVVVTSNNDECASY